MGDQDFSSADPWGIPVEEVAVAPEPVAEPATDEPTEPAAEEVEEQVATEEVEEPGLEAEAEAETVEAEEPPEEVEEPEALPEAEAAEEEPEAPEEPVAAEEIEESEGEEAEAPQAQADVDTAVEPEPESPVEPSAEEQEAEAEPEAAAVVPSEAETEQPPAGEPGAWEPEPATPKAKARGFSQMLAAALSTIRPHEETEEEAGGEEPSVEAAAEGEEMLDETPSWMIEEVPGPAVTAPQPAAAESEVEAEAPAEEPPVAEAPDVSEEAAEETTAEAPTEEPPVEPAEARDVSEEAPDLEDLVAELAVEAEVESIGEDIQLPDSPPEVFQELEEVSDEEADEALEETEPVDEESAPVEPSSAEAESPMEAESITAAEKVVVASPGVEWGSRWRETAQGWVEEEEGRSTWRPIVATGATLAQWDVDTYLGVVAGDVAVSVSDDPAAVVAEARSEALQRMLDDAVARGAHAVVGASVGMQEVGSGLVVTASGTAVTLRARD